MKKLLVLVLAGVIACGISFGCKKAEPAKTNPTDTTKPAPAEPTPTPTPTPEAPK